jgi:molybdate-binding protein
MIPSDGLAECSQEDDKILVKLHDDSRVLSNSIAIAGCAPTLPLWARSAERWHPGLRTFCIQINSTEALRRLMRDEVHAAGIHIYGNSSGDGNLLAVQRILGERSVALINLGIWNEGFVVAKGNPKGIRSAEDIVRPDVKLINRELGAGSRLILDRQLKIFGGDISQINGYNRCATNHRDVVLAVKNGVADVGVAIESVAAAYNLDFIPIHTVQYDLVFLKEYLEYEPVQKLLSTLSHRWIKTQLSTTGGFDTRLTGDIVAMT